MAGVLAGCSGATYTLPVRVPAQAETQPVPSRDDAADDPAIWLHPSDPAESLIVATDKRAGLALYRLDGRQVTFVKAGNLNNVDLRQGSWNSTGQTLIVASQRIPSQLVLLSLRSQSPRATPELTVARRHDLPMPDPYGICMYQNGDATPYVIINDKSGQFYQYEVTENFDITLVREWRTDTQPEGCVADDETGQLYIGEEGRGIWRLDADPGTPAALTLLDSVGGGRLVADVEGLALYTPRLTSQVNEPNLQRYLVASSQGNSSFVIYRLPGGQPAGAFHVTASGSVDGVSGTDGLEITAHSLPGFPSGLMVVQDDQNLQPNSGRRDNQNFKLVSWKAVEQALGLDQSR